MTKTHFDMVKEYIELLFTTQTKLIFDKLKSTFSGEFDTVKEQIQSLDAAIKDFEPYDDSHLQAKIDEVAKSIPEVPEPFDPSPLQERIDEVAKSIPKEYDDTPLQERIDEVEKSIPVPFDDTELIEKVNAIQPVLEAKIESAVKEMHDTIPAPFDDSAIKEEIKGLAETIPAKYDDTPLLERIDEMKEAHAKELEEIKKAFEGKIATIEKELSAPLKVEVPEAKHFTGTPAEKGAMILHDNNLYVNLLDANDSEPSEVNKSYKLLIKAPKAMEHKGVYDKAKTYELNDVVMWENASWVKTASPSQELPGEGWKLLAKAVRGKKGEKGEATIVSADYDDVIQNLTDKVMILEAQLKGFADDVDTTV